MKSVRCPRKEIKQRIKDNIEALDKMKFQKAVGGEVKNPVQVRFSEKRNCKDENSSSRARNHSGEKSPRAVAKARRRKRECMMETVHPRKEA